MKRKYRLQRVLGLSLLLLAGAGSIQAKTRLVYCIEGNPEGFSPALYTSGTTFDASAMPIFNRLIQFKKGTAEVDMALAERVEVSEDGKRYTFHLRQGVPFHSNKVFKPSRHFNADDVLFTFGRMFNPNHPWHKVSNGKYYYFYSQGIAQNVREINKVDDYTVEMVLNEADATFTVNLGHPAASIASAEYAEQMMTAGTPEVLDQQVIGTGPFEFVMFRPDSTVRYKAFENYWRGKPAIDELIFSVTPDPTVRAAKLERGECDVIAYPNAMDIQKLKKTQGVRLQQAPAMNVGYMAMNTRKAPFDDVRVRQALNMATNKQDIVKHLYEGLGVVEKNPFPPTIWSYNHDIQDYPYDIEKAKALLAEAGVENLKLKLWAMPVSRPYNPNARKMAEMVQADWKKIGVDVEIVSYEWAEYLQRARKGEHDVMMYGWTTANGDPDNFMFPLLSCDAAENGGNLAFWCDKAFDNLIKKAKQTADKAERTQLYQQAQEIFHQQVPWIPVAHSIMVTGMRDHVENYQDSPFSLHEFEEVRIKP